MSNTWVTCLGVGDNLGKLGLIPHTFPVPYFKPGKELKDVINGAEEWSMSAPPPAGLALDPSGEA